MNIQNHSKISSFLKIKKLFPNLKDNPTAMSKTTQALIFEIKQFFKTSD